MGSYSIAGVSSLAYTNAQSIGVWAAASSADYSYGVQSVGSANDQAYGVYGEGTVASDVYGIYGKGNRGSSSTTGLAIGVAAEGSGGHDCYGLSAVAITSGANEYGLYAHNNGYSSSTTYAGYFGGDVYTTGSYLPSDQNLKENVVPFENALSIISKINPKTYTFKQSEEFLGLNLPKGQKFGFISQEVEATLPSFVKKTHNPEIKNHEGKIISKSFDFLAIDYVAFIPVLLEGIKEQQKQIEEFSQKLKELTSVIQGLKPNMPSESDSKVGSALYQNVPNPFSETTYIKFHLTGNEQQAAILVFDMNGLLLKKFVLDTQKSDGEITIVARDLKPGMYYYSLVADQKEIDTKKMILTD